MRKTLGWIIVVLSTLSFFTYLSEEIAYFGHSNILGVFSDFYAIAWIIFSLLFFVAGVSILRSPAGGSVLSGSLRKIFAIGCALMFVVLLLFFGLLYSVGSAFK